jgi:cobalt/nickel transport system ATP-binding protein
MKDVILKAEDLYFSYDDENTHSLNGLTLEIERGKKIAIMGANGSGKSTFFLCCNGIHKPSKGTIYFNGKPLDYSKKGLLELRSKIGIVFQDPDNQLFSASVYQEISFGVLNLGIDQEDAKKEVEQVIDHLEITPFRHKPTHALSGGQKKQVSIADILVMHPDIIILDEPAAALDPKHTIMVNKIVNELTASGITVMMATHDVNYAYEWADEVILFHEGKVLSHGVPEDVFENQSALALTNLEQPAVLQLFDRLCKKKILKPDLKTPRKLADLENYIEEINENHTYIGGTSSMNKEGKRGILVVSFGTSHNDTREVTIDAIERDIQETYPQEKVYRAWTSKMIMAKVLKRDGVKIMNVTEAMEQMKADGVTDVIVQPTHVMNGLENDWMKEDALKFQQDFSSIQFGNPLLTTMEDNEAVIEAIADEFSDLEEGEALVLMGHGTTHYANSVYAALDYAFKDKGHKNIFLGTVEAYPSMESIMRLVEASGAKKVRLAPFMIVAGDHAKNDLSGEDEDSWYNQFKSAGYEVTCVLKGLGEYPSIRKMLLQHIADVVA